LPRPGAQPTGHSRCGHRPAVGTASLGGRRSASTRDTLAGSAGGGRCPLPQSAGVHGWSATGGPGVPLLLLRGCGGVRGGPRPSGQHPAALPAGCRGVRFRGPLLGFRASSTPPAASDGPDAPTVDAAGGHRQPQAPGAADTCDGRQRCAALRQRHARQPATAPSTATRCPTRNGTARCGSGQHPPWPDRQIRSLSAVGKPASSWKGSAAQESRPFR
jgi:hypothetical protein